MRSKLLAAIAATACGLRNSVRAQSLTEHPNVPIPGQGQQMPAEASQAAPPESGEQTSGPARGTTSRPLVPEA
jgi:hypothetical protein